MRLAWSRVSSEQMGHVFAACGGLPSAEVKKRWHIEQTRNDFFAAAIFLVKSSKKPLFRVKMKYANRRACLGPMPGNSEKSSMSLLTGSIKLF